MHKRGKSVKKNPVLNRQVSPKQHLSECLDLVSELLREVISIYCSQHTHECLFNPSYCFLTQIADLSTLAGFILDKSRFDSVIQHFEKQPLEQLTKKQFVRSWLLELKAFRNAWAHWPTENINYRMGSRAYDTLALLYRALNGDLKNKLYAKIEADRNRLLLVSIREGEFKVKHA